ncbi:energy transducer TonB [Aquiflexum lacus]|uniref:energy transducer TonB n=1 Tax=Aquiflexum lacus TaxID=2483805 RepID=UPI0018945283|nr:energy transducer TonB [Aquiflexum lacus]
MEPKKHPHLELTSIRPMLQNFALLISVSIVLFAFEWKSPKDLKTTFSAIQMQIWDDTPDIPITIHELPPPPISSPILIEIDNNEIIEKENHQIDINVDESMISPVPFILIPPVIEIADEVLDFTEVMPEPIGGMAAWNNYLNQNLKYPTPAKRMGVEGTVYISFIVNSDGSISDVELMRGIGAGCDEEAMRVITNAPAWKPGKQSSRPVRVRMRLPIRFKLQ